ncbi:Rieske 2Fe-2S domain-containing protein [Paracraurococcus ruber]|uniref:(2Fe-2S)-binding protein n=1 Tax=Paracraurococcus ruber TaxID=77675 RepID=A0ABS1D0T3_9PROT|nr:Rieske 2Fe-2S domain-containing protein [Paracraurococcus ruber]MBK1660215.1 (2Fe-2S)-binding protein [Paracraurococcus ruber]TDG29671.1 (2Fe-2S)-binding protein [Paracraurococcus ruber]
MSARYVPVGWTRAKLAYDAVLLLAVATYVLLYLHLGPHLADPARPLDGPTLLMRAWGSAAFLLLTLALAIGPLARLDRRCLPLLYNRRHLGVLTCLAALSHAAAVLDWYFAFSPTPSLVALLSSEPVRPFIPFGLGALLILCLLAATSHDFWLSFLTPPAWKALHMSLYLAYALVVAHVGFGALQAATDPALALVVLASAALLVALHVAAGLREARRDAGIAPPAPEPPWVLAGPAEAIPEGGAVTIRPLRGEAVAIFRHQGRLSAVTNLCAHQNGPLGEGRVVDGCITCPWHGFQYRLEDGCAPPPYTERLATYRLRQVGGEVWLDPRPNPPGTRVEPVAVA